VECPWGSCDAIQYVLVPYEGRDVGVEVWLGQTRTPRPDRSRPHRWPPR
jgi:hypothetical protein